MKRILCIEPNTVLADVYRRYFCNQGYEVSCVTTAQAGIDAADDAQPDIVILEMQLVQHNGIAFLHEFRSYVEWQQIPVILNTLVPPSRVAAVEPPLRRDFGVVSLLYKPQTSLAKLHEAVRRELAAVAA
ncbi:MAG: response regulator [Candidatus Saccharimonadales bacterium]